MENQEDKTPAQELQGENHDVTPKNTISPRKQPLPAEAGNLQKRTSTARSGEADHIHSKEVVVFEKTPFWRNMLVQIPPVVVAVLLAFAVNSYWSAHQQNKLVTQSLDNINRELSHNLDLYNRIIELDKRNLANLNAEIVALAQTGYNDSVSYGEGLNIFILTEGAWQAASLSNAITNFDPDRLEELSNIYSVIHFRNLEHSATRPPAYAIYDEDRVMAYLKENRVVLEDHLAGCQYEADMLRNYLTSSSGSQ